MSEILYKVPEGWPARTHADDAKYRDMYARSVLDPEGFWGEHGKRIDWIKLYTWVKRTSFAPDNVSIEWFGDGTTNVSLNCIDRHLAKRADQVEQNVRPSELPPLGAALHEKLRAIYDERVRSQVHHFW